MLQVREGAGEPWRLVAARGRRCSSGCSGTRSHLSGTPRSGNATSACSRTGRGGRWLGAGVASNRRRTLAREARALRQKEMTGEEIAKHLGISRSYAFSLIHDPTGSKEKARKKSYAGICLDCGRMTDGSNGKKKAPKYCYRCAPVHAGKRRTTWTKEVILQRAKDWNDIYGRPPRVVDWHRTTNRTKGMADADKWPWFTDVCRKFGSWGNMLEEAGFQRRRPPRSGTKITSELMERRLEFTRRMMANGVPRHRIAKRFWKPWGYAHTDSLSSTFNNHGLRSDPGWYYRPNRHLTPEEMAEGMTLC